MRESDVKLWLINETSTFLSNSSLVSLSNPDTHVDTAEAHDDKTYPFIGLQSISSTPQSAGIGSGDVFVDSINYDTNGVVESIDFYREVTYRAELIPTTDGDEQLRDDLSDDLSDYLARIARKGEYPTYFEELSSDDSSPSDRTSDFVRATGVAVEVTYKRLETDTDITPAATVNLDIDVADDLGEYDDTMTVDGTLSIDSTITIIDEADAYEETF